jgi:hypothetical protein
MRRYFFSAILLVGLQSLASETMKGAQKDYEAFKKEMSIKVESLDKQIDELKTKAKDKGKVVKEATLKDLEETRKGLHSDMEEFEGKSKENWKAMKKKLSESAELLHSKLQKALED